jgi:putative ABC transport system permease protein
MGFFAVLRLAFISLGRNKTRSFLTALGIIIGVSSVITMVGLGQGAYASVQDQISKMGTNLIMVIPGSASSRGLHGGMGTMSNLQEDDATAISNECPAVGNVSPVVRTAGQVVYTSQNWSTSLWGANELFLDIRAWKLESGRFFNDREVRAGVKICVLGKTVADNLFGDIDPLGKIIRYKRIPLEVVGVLESRGQTGMGQDQDDIVLAPLKTVQKRFLGISHVHMLMLSARRDDLVDQAKEEISQLLRRRNKLQETDEDTFNIRTQADIAEMAGSTLGIIAILLGSIASVSLLVGGIGIMNIMLVSVTERTREIGIRMAVGARGRDILLQFLAEAIALSCVGGVLGICLGACFIHVISHFSEWPTIISLPAVTVSVVFSALVGIFFGLYPAWKASQLDPIEALRFE